MMRTTWGAALALALAAVAILVAGSAQATDVGGTITVDTTWTLAASPYVVTSTITIQGTNGADGVTTLTIEPGVVVKFNLGTAMYVGTNSATLPGALVAKGTASSPITFTSNQAAGSQTRGHWGPLQTQQYSSDALTTLENVTIEYGGRASAGLYAYYSSPKILNAVLREHNNDGVYVYGDVVRIADSTISRAAGYGVRADAGGLALTNVEITSSGGHAARAVPDASFEGVRLGSNGFNDVEIAGGQLARDQRWGRLAIVGTGATAPYVLVGDPQVYGTHGADGVTTLTIDPGAEVRFGASRSLFVGTNSATLPGALDARGTTASPILLTSAQTGTKTRGYWGRVVFQDFSRDDATFLENVTIEYGGAGSQGATYLYRSAPKVFGVTWRENAPYALYTYDAAALVRSSTFTSNGGTSGYAVYAATQTAGWTLVDVTIAGTTGRPIRMPPDATLVRVATSASSVGGAEIFGATATRDATWIDLGEPYYVSGDVTVQGTNGADGVTTLTIEPGTTVSFAAMRGLTVGSNSATVPGALDARGTIADPILLTSGGAKAKGTWSRVEILDYARDASTFLENVTIEYGGYGGSGATYLYRSAPKVFGVTWRENGVHALYAYDATGTVASSTFTANGGANGYAVYLATQSAGFGLEDVSITGTTGRAARLAPDTRLVRVATASSSVGGIEIFGATLQRDGRWPAVGEPYYVSGDVNVQGTFGPDGVTSLTIEPGVEVRFAQYRGLSVGSNAATAPGALDARGTEASPILLTTAQTGTKARGFWSRVELHDYSRDAMSFLENVTIEYGGYANGGATYFYRSAPTVRNVLWRENGIYAVWAQEAGVVIRDSTFTSNGGTNGYALYQYSQGPGFGLDGVAIGATTGRAMRIAPDAQLARVSVTGSSIAGAEVFGATMQRDATWPALGEPYVIVGDVNVQGTFGSDAVTTLTIEPGAVVSFAQYRSLSVGSNSATSPGALVAAGTDAQRILFTSAGAKVAGFWGRIELHDYSSDAISRIENATIEYGGYGNAGATYAYRSAPKLERVTWRANGIYALYLYDGAATVRESVFEANGGANGYAVYQYATGSPASLVDVAIRNTTGRAFRMAPGSTFTRVAVSGSSVPGAEIFGGTLVDDATWTPLGEPYYLSGDVTVQGKSGGDQLTTLTIAPGTTVSFGQYRTLAIGSNSATQPGALVAVGTEAAPVTFTSGQAGAKTRGYWARVEINDYASDAKTTLANVTIEYGGYGSAGGLYLYRAQPTLRDLVLRENAPHAVYVYDTAGRIERATFDRNGASGGYAFYQYTATPGWTLQDVAFTATTGRPIRMHPATTLAGVSLSGSTAPGAEVLAGTIARDARWTPLGEPYVLVGDVDVQGNDADGVATLAIDPGVVVQLAQYRTIAVGSPSNAALKGALVARGTPSAPVTFTSTQADGAKTAGYWSRIVFYDHASDATSAIEHALVEAATYGVHLDRAAPAIRESTMRLLSSYGVYGNQVVGATIENNTISRPTHGLYFDNSRELRLRGNTVDATQYPGYFNGVDASVVTRNVLRGTTYATTFQASSNGNLVYDNVFSRSDAGRPVADHANPPSAWNVAKQPGPNVVGGPFLGGNAYSDYLGVDYTNPSDGFGDTNLPYGPTGLFGPRDDLPLAPPERWIPDLDAPTSLASLAGTLTPSSWYRGAVTVTITGEDAYSGVGRLDSALDGGDAARYAGPFAIAVDGEHTLAYWATDRAGNVETPNEIAFKLDGTPPALPFEPDPANRDDLCFYLNATDAHSGLASLTWTIEDIDGNEVANGTADPGIPACGGLSEDGRYRVLAIATDVAGNEAGLDSGLLVVDLKPPTLTVLRPLPNEIYAGGTRVKIAALPAFPVPENGSVVIGETEIIVNATDGGTGVARGELLVDGVLVATDDHAHFRWWWGRESAGGLHELTVRAIDGAGRVAERSFQVLLVSDPIERADRFTPGPESDTGCVAVGAWARGTHGTLTDASANRAVAIARSNLTAEVLRSDAQAGGADLAPLLTRGALSSACATDTTPVHAACGEARAAGVTIDLTSLLLPVQLEADALGVETCTDPATGTFAATRARLDGVASGRAVAQEITGEPNQVIELPATPTAIVPDAPLVIVVANEEREWWEGDCRVTSAAALHVYVLDPLRDYLAPAAEVAVGWASTIACRMPAAVTVESDPSGPGVVPGATASASARAAGAPGQIPPTGALAFRLCAPGAPLRTGCFAGESVGAAVPLGADGAADGPATGETWRIGRYCWRALYSGDAYYRPASGTNGVTACFLTAKQPVTGTLRATPAGATVVPGTAQSATARISGEPGLPVPAGTVTFYLCRPAELDANARCLPGKGVQTGSARPLDAIGGATSAATTDTTRIGTHCFRAAYSGDAVYAPADVASALACFTTVRQPSSATITVSPAGPVSAGASVASTVVVSGGGPTPTGTVTFRLCYPRDVVPGTGCAAGGAPVGGVTALAAGGRATSPATTDTKRVGAHCFRVEYSGDGYYLPATFSNDAAGCVRTLNPCATAGAEFGAAAAAAGGKLVVGAPGHNGGRGAVCVFNGATSEIERMVTRPGAAAGDRFGAAIADVSGAALVGAPGASGGAGAAHLVRLSDGAVTATLSNPAPSAGDAFGAAVAGSAGRALVGAPGEDGEAADVGVAYLFSAAGALVQTFENPTPESGDRFGAAVAGLADAEELAVSAPGDDAWEANAGAVYVMDVESGEVARTVLSLDPESEDAFGASLASDGVRLLAGAPGADGPGGIDAGAAHLVDAATGSVTRAFTGPGAGAGDRFGAAVAFLEGNALVGAPGASAGKGAAFLLDDASGALLHSFRSASASASLGAAVAALGDDALVGAPGDDANGANAGASQLYADTTAPPLATLPSGLALPALADFSRALAASGDDVVAGAPGANAAYLLDGATGAVLATYAAPGASAAGDRFGAAVAASATHVVVGAPGADAGATDTGLAFVFTRAGALVATLESPNAVFQDDFGAAVAIDGNRVLVGAPGDDAGAPNSGRAYVFDLAGQLVATLANPSPAFNDALGAAVALAGGRALVGAPGDDGGAIDAGAAHAYDSATGALLASLANPTPAIGDSFGAAVAFSGAHALVGAPGDDGPAGETNAGAVHRYDAAGALARTYRKAVPAVDDAFGSAVAAGGALLVAGAPGDDAAAPGAGSVVVLDLATGAHVQTFLNPASGAADAFGSSVAMRASDVVAGAPRSDVPAADAGRAFVLDAATGRASEAW